ncbi:hypothetical protein OKW22_000163 [Bacilli bacterium PM5-3]|nr:hypothetical protein [Bacilli bacterium PM5-3]MDH6603428.1 hypothetical protein [Bacilli bacterium PM5-9]
MMEELRPADLILARRTLLNDSETFDLLIHEDQYYRIVITNYFKEGKVKIITNIDDFSNEPLFEYSSDDELLDSLFIQAKFIFESFIEQEYIILEEDFNVEVNVIDISDVSRNLDVVRDKLTKFISENKIDERISVGEDLLDEDSSLFLELEKVSDEFNDISGTIDEIFIDEDILDGIAQKYYRNEELN